MKSLPIFVCLLAFAFYVFFDVTSADALKNPRECPKGVPLSACQRRIHFFPFPRVGRRMDPNFARSQRGFGLLKQPRVGRSDPAVSELNKWGYENEDDNSWLVSGEKEENLKNLDNYLSAQRRDSNAPWAFFLITPNFQNMDQQQQTMDNLITRLDYANDELN